MPEIFSSTMFRPFYSLFRSGTSNAFSGDAGRNHRGYTLTRGTIRPPNTRCVLMPDYRTTIIIGATEVNG